MIATGVPVYFGSLPGPEPGVAIIGDYEDKGVVTQSQRWADRDFQRYAGLELQSCKDYHKASVAGPGTPVRYPYLSHIRIATYLKKLIPIYLNYPKYLSQLSYISCHLSHLSATCLCSG